MLNYKFNTIINYFITNGIVFFVSVFLMFKKRVNNTIKTISGYDLTDDSESYEGKNRLYVIYKSNKNFDRNLRSIVNNNETDGQFTPRH